MKKLIILLLLVPTLCIAQKDKSTMSLLISVPKLGGAIEYNKTNFGIGLDVLTDKVEYDYAFFQKVNGDYNLKIFNNRRTMIGVYGISPTFKGFDVILGGGRIGYSIYDTWTEGDYVNGYTRSNGTKVNGYYRNQREVSGYRQVDNSFYLLSGIGYSLPLSGDYITLKFRGVARYLPKYGNEELGRTISPNLMMGILFKIN